MQTDLGRIKGAAFREFLIWYGRTRGDDALVRAATGIEPKWRALLDESRPGLGVLASDWYPAGAVHALLDRMVASENQHERVRLAEDGARAVMSRTLRGLYRTLFDWIATPARYARFGPKLWNAYYDTGSFRIEMPTPNSAVCTISGWTSHHAFICDLNRGAALSIYENMGCHDVTVERVACVGSGAPHCRFVSKWTATDAPDP